MQFEADRRAFIITLNSFGTELSKDTLEALFPTCGQLCPEGLRLLAQVEDFEQMKRVADHYGVRTWPRFPALSLGPWTLHSPCQCSPHQGGCTGMSLWPREARFSGAEAVIPRGRRPENLSSCQSRWESRPEALSMQ